MSDSTSSREAPTLQAALVSGDADTMAAGSHAAGVGPFKRGDRIGRYVVLEERGRGGMGVVYAAYDPELDRRVALKLLRPRVMGGVKHTDPEARALLLHEAQAAAKLRHPNVTTVHDVGQTDSGSVFLAMEYVDGQDLHAWLGEGQSWADVLEAFIAAGRGLEAAHAAGIVHRDFKPGNVLRDSSGQVMVTDFGLAQALHRDEPEVEAHESENPVTHEGLPTVGEGVVGTPAYMPPEQYKGQPGDERSDVFAFCVSLYEGLYGELPFQGRSLAELVQQVRTGDVEVPKDREVPSWVRRAVLRGLAPEPDSRWPSMTPLLAALSHDPAARRRRVLTIGSGALVLIALGATLGGPEADPWCEAQANALDQVWGQTQRATLEHAFASTGTSYSGDLWERTQRRLELYAAGWDAERASLCAAPGELDRRRRVAVQACLDLRLSDLGEVVVLLSEATPSLRENPIRLLDELSAPKTCSEAEQPDGLAATAPDAETKARWTSVGGKLRRAKLLMTVDRLDDAEAVVAEAMERLGDDDNPNLRMEAELVLASVARERGAHAEDYDHLVESLRYALASGSGRDTVRCLVRLIHSEIRVSKNAEAARRWARLAEGVIEKLGGDEYSEVNVQNAVAGTYLHETNYHRARDLLLAANERAEQSDAMTTSLREAIRNNLGAAYAGIGDLDHAIEVFEHQLELRRQRYGPRHPRLKSLMWNLAQVYYKRGELDAAVEWLEEVRSLALEAQGPTSPDLVNTLAILGDIYRDRNQIAEGLKVRQQAHDIAVEVLEPTDYWRFSNDLDLVYAYIEAQQPDQALGIAEDLVEVVADTPVVAWRAKALTARGIARRKTGNPLGALHDAEEALAILQRNEERSGLPGAYSAYGNALLSLKRPAEALAAFDLSIAVTQPKQLNDTARTLGYRAQALTALDRTDEAIEAWEYAIEYAVEHGPHWNLCWTRVELVELLTESGGDLEQARRHALAVVETPRQVGGFDKCRETAQAWLDAH